MSDAKNQTLRIWQDVRGQLGRIRYQLYDCSCCRMPNDRVCTRSAGNYQFVDRCTGKATELQNRVIADGLTLLLIVWSDSTLLPLKHETVRNLIKILGKVPVSTLVAGLKEADAFLIAEVQKERICPFGDFKHHLDKRFPELVGLWAPARGLWNELRISTRRSLTMRPLHTMFSFITRLNVPDREDLQAEARTKFLEQEQELDLSCIIQDGSETFRLKGVYTTDEVDILNEWFPNKPSAYQQLYGRWVPRHGSGSVADSEGISLSEKYAALGTDKDLDFLDLFTGGPGYCRSRRDFARCAEVTFVAKSVDKLRTICKEPATLMFYQEGFLTTIVDYINRHEYLRDRIQLDKAYVNADLARRGSISGGLSTIDLSAASDSVSWGLIRAWFSNNVLWEALALTRSDYFSLDNTVRVTNKFAPMGSALCFPTECIVFAAMCEATIRESGADPHTSEYHVYGDDIIIETCYAEALIRRLEANGFKVNTSKSFYHVTSHNFRESCGGEYLDGDNVTPFRISRKFEGLDVGGRHDRWVALIDLANRSFLWLPTLRSFIISELLKLPREFQPFFTDSWHMSLDERGKPIYEVSKLGGLVTLDANNYRLRKRKSRVPWSMTPYMYQHGGARISKGLLVYAEEDIRLYEWLRSNAGRRGPIQDNTPYLLHTPATRSRGSKVITSTWSRSLDRDFCPRTNDSTMLMSVEYLFHLKDLQASQRRGSELHRNTAFYSSYTNQYPQEVELDEWLLRLDWD